MKDLPALITPSVLLASAVLIVSVAVVLHRGAVLAGGSPRSAMRLALAVTGVLAAWFALDAGIAATGLYSAQAEETVPWIGVGLVVPLVVGVLALRLPAVAAALSHPRAAALLVAAQTFRIVGWVFLVLLAAGQLPAGFALPAGIGDVLVGVAAPFVAVALWRRPQRRALGLVFTTFALLDLVVAVGVGVSLSPGPLQVMVTDPTTFLMGVLPMVLVPTFAVPLAMVLHVATFRLLRAPRPTTAPVVA